MWPSKKSLLLLGLWDWPLLKAVFVEILILHSLGQNVRKRVSKLSFTYLCGGAPACGCFWVKELAPGF